MALDPNTQSALQAAKNAEVADAATQQAAGESTTAAMDAAEAEFDDAIAGEQGSTLN